MVAKATKTQLIFSHVMIPITNALTNKILAIKQIMVSHFVDMTKLIIALTVFIFTTLLESAIGTLWSFLLCGKGRVYLDGPKRISYIKGRYFLYFLSQELDKYVEFRRLAIEWKETYRMKVEE